MPKQVPTIISSIKLLLKEMEESAPFNKFSSLKANKDYSCVKEKVDLIDKDNMVYGLSHVEGGVIGTKVAYTNCKIKITPKEGGGTISTTTCSYDTLQSVPSDEAKVEEIKAGSVALFRMLEEPLISKPAFYC